MVRMQNPNALKTCTSRYTGVWDFTRKDIMNLHILNALGSGEPK